MERKMLVVCCVVGFLGILSAALGFAAEAISRNMANVEYPGCIDSMFPAQILAKCSGVSLILAMIIFEVTVACLHGGRPLHQQNCKMILALICLIGSWYTYNFALLLLAFGVVPNNSGDTPGCFVVKPGFFAGGAALSLTTVLLSVTSYLISTSKSVINPTGMPSSQCQGAIAMGQHQIHPV